MSTTNTCPECGTRVPADAPRGLCPRCLMGAAYAATGSYLPETRSSSAPAGPTMLDLPEFLRAIRELGVVPADALERFRTEAGESAEQLARILVREKQLTGYQAGAVLQGKARGLLIGHYLVLEKLGLGGMGVVFRARHRPSGRTVALKILPPSFGREGDAVRRFRREFQVASRLSHPNLVQAIEASEDRGVHYLTMEYIPGYDLDRLVRLEGPMDLRLALHCAIQVARGLEAAHAQGVVHRDIKPGNIMIDPTGTVRVLDLGLARVIEATSQFGKSMAGSLTQTGAYMGTVDFLAPEQAEDAKSADQRADIYSLGCTLYYLLTGKPPFPGETVLKRLMAHLNRPAPSLRTARPEVPEALENVYQKMMAKRPVDRPPDMSAVVNALEACRASAREAGDASADLKSFARTALKRAPERRRAGPDDSALAQPRPEAGGLVPGPGLNLEDVIENVREKRGPQAIPEETLPPIVMRPEPLAWPRSSQRRLMPRFGLIGLTLIGLAVLVTLVRFRNDPGKTPAMPGEPRSEPLSVSRPQEPEELDDPTKGKVLYIDDFNTPESGWLTDSTADVNNALSHRGYFDGLYRIEVGQPKHQLSSSCPKTVPAEFTCELIAQVQGDKPTSDGTFDLNVEYGPVDRFFRILLHPDGRIRFVKNGTGDNPSQQVQLGMFRPPQMKTGARERNTIVLHVRKEWVEVFLNGSRVGEPMVLDWRADPTNLAVGVSCESPVVRGEIDRIEIREPDPLEASQVIAAATPPPVEIAPAVSDPGPARILLSEEFQGTAEGWQLSSPEEIEKNVNGAHGVRDGAWFCVSQGSSAWGWSVPGGTYPEFEAEIGVRVVAQPGTDSRGGALLHLLSRDPKVEGERGERGVQIRVDAAGRVSVEPSFYGRRFHPGGPWQRRVAHPALGGNGQTNVLTVRLRGRRLELLAGGSPVCEPLKLDWDLTPTSMLVGADSWSGELRAEFDRIMIRTPPPAVPDTADEPKGSPWIDDFNNTRSGWAQTSAADRLTKKAAASLHGYDAGVWTCQASGNGHYSWGRSTPFTLGECELTLAARVVGDSPRSRGSAMVHFFNKRPAPGATAERAFQIRIDGEGRLFIEPSFWTARTFPDGPWKGPITHPAIQAGGGAFNVWTVRVHRRQLEIRVNGAAVCDPVAFDWDLTPLGLNLGVQAESGTVRAEFDRMEIRPYGAETLPDARPIDPSLGSLIEADDLSGPIGKLGTGVFPMGEGLKPNLAGYDRGTYFVQNQENWQGAGNTDLMLDLTGVPFQFEVSGRVLGATPEAVGSWGVVVGREDRRGLHVAIDRTGALTIAPPFWNPKEFPNDPRQGPIRHAAIRGGDQFNRLGLRVENRQIEVLVNGVKVGEPIALDYDMLPAAALFMLTKPDFGTIIRIELDRVEVRELRSAAPR